MSAATKENAALCKAVAIVVREQVEQLERRLAVLELGRKDAVRYRGTFEDGLRYYPGDCVTCKDTIWYAQCETDGTVRPGECPDWKLMVRRDPKIPRPGGGR